MLEREREESKYKAKVYLIDNLSNDAKLFVSRLKSISIKSAQSNRQLASHHLAVLIRVVIVRSKLTIDDL